MTAQTPDIYLPLDRPAWLPEHAWPFALRGLRVDGHLLHVLDEGDGPVLLFVHAGLWSFVWRDVIVRLSKRFRCVALDFPGAGLSLAAPGYRPTIEAHSRVLDAVVDRLGLRGLTLVAHDLGGLVGLATATRRQELVRALALVNAFGWTPRPALRGMLRFMGSGPVRGLDARTNFVYAATSGRFGVGRHYDRASRHAFRGPAREPARRRPFHDLMRDASREGPLYAAIEQALRTTLADRPALTVFGQFNDPLRFQRRWATFLPHVHQVVVPRGNHFPMCDDPDLFAEALQRWHHTAVETRSGR